MMPGKQLNDIVRICRTLKLPLTIGERVLTMNHQHTIMLKVARVTPMFTGCDCIIDADRMPTFDKEDEVGIRLTEDGAKAVVTKANGDVTIPRERPMEPPFKDLFHTIHWRVATRIPMGSLKQAVRFLSVKGVETITLKAYEGRLWVVTDNGRTDVCPIEGEDWTVHFDKVEIGKCLKHIPNRAEVWIAGATDAPLLLEWWNPRPLHYSMMVAPKVMVR